MAGTVQPANLFKKLGARIAEAHEGTKDAPVKTGMQQLPDGINNGVAQLTVMEFIDGKKPGDLGKQYFRAAGVIKEPKVHAGIKVEGKQTSTLIPMFDTPDRDKKKTFAHHWEDYLAVFKRFGIDMPKGQQPGETKEACSERVWNYLIAAAQLLVQQKPHFVFRTWKGEKAKEGKYKDKEPMVQEFWDEKVEYTVTVDPASAVTMNGTQHAPPPTMMAPPPATLAPNQPDVEPPQDDDLVALAEMADADPDGVTEDAVIANGKLTEACRQHGMTDEQIGALPNWATAVTILQGGATPAAATPTAGLPAPEKGQVVTYGGVAGHKVTSANPDLKTVTLNKPDGKPVVGADKKLLKVPFAELS